MIALISELILSRLHTLNHVQRDQSVDSGLKTNGVTNVGIPLHPGMKIFSLSVIDVRTKDQENKNSKTAVLLDTLSL